jgi:hypothetical protein
MKKYTVDQEGNITKVPEAVTLFEMGELVKEKQAELANARQDFDNATALLAKAQARMDLIQADIDDFTTVLVASTDVLGIPAAIADLIPANPIP